MKTIRKIAKTELQVLFYSPVAWLILVIFAFQAGLVYTGLFDKFVYRVNLGGTLGTVTANTFGGRTGLFTVVQNYLYLYIPLLTMGIMSRELSSGSIKLLYSSPVTNIQIVFGKYAALVIYALGITAVLGVFVMHSVTVIEHVEYKLILTGLLGLFLIVCAYAAIGLFMSSITSYAVVAAMGTLAVLALLNMARGIWQDIEFVRDITYWLSISGRSNTFIRGMITSEDVLYFVMVIVMFLSFTIIKLQATRQKTSFIAAFSRYAAVTLLVVLVGYVSSMPKLKFYADVTYSKVNTLTPASQKVLNKLDGPLTIHTYVNFLDPNYHYGVPGQYKSNLELFENYTRFKPEIKFQTHYYYHRADYEYLNRKYPRLNDDQRIDTLIKLNNWKFPIPPYSAIKNEVDLKDEGFRFVRVLERPGGKRTFLRVFNDIYTQPFESEISAAFKRIVMDKLPTVGFVTGHGERSSSSLQDRGYRMMAQEKTFRGALINQGFDFQDVSLDSEVSDSVNILVIAEPRQAYTASQQANLNKYIASGRNLILAGEPASRDYINPLAAGVGISFLPGVLVRPTENYQADLMLMSPTPEAKAFSFHLGQMAAAERVLTMPGVAALAFDPSGGFTAKTLFTSDSSDSWNEQQTTNFIDDSVRFDPLMEAKKPYPAVMALSREINGKTQKVLVTGDADWISNGELGIRRNKVSAGNFPLISAVFFWLTDEEVPIDMRRKPPIDRKISTTKSSWGFTGPVLKWGFPIGLCLSGLLTWMRRRRR